VAEEKPHSFLDPQVLAQLAHLPLVSRFAMEGSVSGHHKSPHRGSSVEFAEYRAYVPGDDLRRLDWRVLGRTDRYYMKEFEADTNLRLCLILDASASMGFAGNAGPSKFAFARQLAGSLAYLAVQQGDAAGLYCVGEKAPPELPPRRNPSHLQEILNTIESLSPSGPTTLLQTLHDLAEKIRRRALVIVLSDFFCELEPLLGCLQHLRFQKHDLAVFHLLDRTELDFKFDRPLRFQDLESPFSLVTEPAMVRDEYLRAFDSHRARLRQACLEFNADYREVVTDADPGKVLADFLTERAQLVGAH
jgi:uncharacterized protein (DUF58 family)